MSEIKSSSSFREVATKAIGNLGKDWVAFIRIILSPMILLLVVSVIALLYYRSTIPASSNLPPLMDAIITIIISIFSGLAGGLIASKWLQFSESNILTTRGKSAIRGLDLLLSSVSTMERRVASYLQDLDLSNKPVLTSYEEIIVRCNSLKEEAINAIEEWQDIIPEAANLKSQISVWRKLDTERLLLTQEISKTQAELALA
jgi:hypothetical protein